MPPVLAYGAGGAGELVPPNQWLLFRVRLVSANGRGGWVKPSAAAKTVASSGGGGFLQQVARKGGLALPGATAMVKRIAEGLRDSIQALLGQAENGDLQALECRTPPMQAGTATSILLSLDGVEEWRSYALDFDYVTPRPAIHLHFEAGEEV